MEKNNEAIKETIVAYCNKRIAEVGTLSKSYYKKVKETLYGEHPKTGE